jgi:hypothetical protein
MGASKKTFADMMMEELLSFHFIHDEGDEDYQYQQYIELKQRQEEQLAYEELLKDKY